MKKVFLLLALVVSTMTAMADSYHDMFVKYQTRTNPDYKMMLQEKADSIMTLAAQRNSKDTAIMRGMVNYITTDFFDDLVDVLEPYYRPYLSEQDMADLMAWEDAHPDYREVTKVISASMQKPEGAKFLATVMADIKMLSKGKKINHPKLNKGISKKYYKAATASWQNPDMKPALQDMGKQVIGLVGKLSQEANKAGTDKMLNSTINYIMQDVPVLYTNMLYEAGVNENEVMLIQEYYSLPGTQHAQKASAAMVRDVIPMTINLIDHIVKWGSAHYPEKLEKLAPAWEQMKGVLK